MSQRRGTTGGVKGSSLPKEHLRGTDGEPLCNARPRRWGHVFVKERPTCQGCANRQLEQTLELTDAMLKAGAL